MTVTMTIDESAFVGSVIEELNKAKIRCHAAMAQEFGESVIRNMESAGQYDSAASWDSLGYMYANEMHGGNRTPHLTLSGDLKDSIIAGISADSESGEVSTSIPYARFHQEGGISKFQGKEYEIPARPFFPIDGGEILPLTASRCVQACAEELQQALQ